MQFQFKIEIHGGGRGMGPRLGAIPWSSISYQNSSHHVGYIYILVWNWGRSYILDENWGKGMGPNLKMKLGDEKSEGLWVGSRILFWNWGWSGRLREAWRIFIRNYTYNHRGVTWNSWFLPFAPWRGGASRLLAWWGAWERVRYTLAPTPCRTGSLDENALLLSVCVYWKPLGLEGDRTLFFDPPMGFMSYFGWK